MQLNSGQIKELLDSLRPKHKAIILTKSEVEKMRSNAYNYIDMNDYIDEEEYIGV